MNMHTPERSTSERRDRTSGGAARAGRRTRPGRAWSGAALAAAAGLVALIAFGGAAPAAAQGEHFGLGFILGEPTGICGKYWLSQTEAMDWAAAWSFVDEKALNLQLDYVIHDFGVFHVSRGALPLYYGIGGRLKFEDDSRLGLRGVLGLDYLFAQHPVDVFVEIAPLVDLAPKTDFGLSGAIGMRIFFQWSRPGP